MAAESKHWADVYAWIIKMIESCTTTDQILLVDTIVKRYKRIYRKDIENTNIYNSITDKMLEQYKILTK